MTTPSARSILLYTLLLFCSCSKPNDNPVPPPGNPNNPAPPAAPDSLLSWKVTDSISNTQGLVDIWFNSPSKGFVAAVDGSLYRTVDSGKTWTYISSPRPRDLINIFFATDKIGFGQGTRDLMVTKDGGDTWSLLPLQTTSAYNIFFTSPSTGYLGDYNKGLYKTTDTGKTWQANGPRGADIAPASFLTPDKGFLLYGDGSLFRTLDGATTWQKISQVPIAQFTPDAMPYNTLQFTDSLTGYIADKSGMLKTIDGGLTWKNTLSGGSLVNIIKFFTPDLGYYKSQSVIYKTIDGGQTWTISCKLPSDNLQGMFFIDSTMGWACTLKGRIIRITP